MKNFEKAPAKTYTQGDYIPAQLSKGKDWVIYYYAWDPATANLRRKREKVNRIENISERKKYAAKLIKERNLKLSQGWSPWVDDLAPNAGIKFTAAIEIFLKRKKLEIRQESIRSYVSHTDRLMDWLKKQKLENITPMGFTRQLAHQYLDHVLDNGVGARTHNNTLRFGRLLFNWMVEKQYALESPFQKIPTIREPEKIRKLISIDDRKKIFDHLEKEDPGFLLACLLLFYAQIRPKEQTFMQVRWIDFEKQVIVVPGQFSKNHKTRYPTIPQALLNQLLKLPWNEMNNDTYIIGKDFKPGPVQLENSKPYGRKWGRIRKKLKLPKEYQFYSLRDSGIVYMLENKVAPNQVMEQAGHSDLSMTSVYAKHTQYKAVDEIRNLSDGF